jgi:cytoskeletal protein CcmA (bactofilin family)
MHMWKRDTTSELAERLATPTSESSLSEPARHQRAYIGKGIVVKGDICGTEDLHVDGEVVGRIDLADHEIVLGADARVKADLTAKTITIGGTVVGSVIATERAAITETGCVEGDLRAPRVEMADGAVFGGRVDTTFINAATAIGFTPPPDSGVAPRIHGVAPSETPRASAAPEPAPLPHQPVDPLPIEPVVPDPSSAPVADLPPARRPRASEQHVAI